MRREGTASTEQACPLKVKKVVGKIRVEGRLVTRWVIPFIYFLRKHMHHVEWKHLKRFPVIICSVLFIARLQL